MELKDKHAKSTLPRLYIQAEKLLDRKIPVITGSQTPSTGSEWLSVNSDADIGTVSTATLESAQLTVA
jgi:hypothetical protein